MIGLSEGRRSNIKVTEKISNVVVLLRYIVIYGKVFLL